jgi:hypothetical protein
MRTAFLTTLLISAAAMACSGCGGPTAQAGSGQAQVAQVEGKEVSLRGCARPAVQKASCMTMRGPGGVVYDVSSASPAPDPARGVSVQLSGVDKGVTSDCGKVLNEVKWNYLSLRCAAAAPTEVAAADPAPKS